MTTILINNREFTIPDSCSIRLQPTRHIPATGHPHVAAGPGPGWYKTMDGVTEGIVDAMAVEIPDSVHSFMAAMAILGDGRNTINMLDDASTSYSYRRLDESTKGNILQWVEARTQAVGRNAHERAVALINVLGGYNSGFKHKPYEAKVGSLSSARNMVTHMFYLAEQVRKADGSPPRYDFVTPHAEVSAVLISCGVPAGYMQDTQMLDYLRTQVALAILQKEVGASEQYTAKLAAFNDLPYVSVPGILSTLAGSKPIPREHPVIHNMWEILRQCQYAVGWYRLRMDLSPGISEGEMDDFITDLTKRFTRKLKARG